MNRHRWPLVLILTLFLSAPVFGTAPVADESYGLASISWQSAAPFDEATLTISGPTGIINRVVFDKGANLTYGLQDQKGGFLADGFYTYELALKRFGSEMNPESGAMRQIVADRQVINRRFWVEGGLLVKENHARPPVVEATGAPADAKAAGAPDAFDYTLLKVSSKIGVGTEVPLAAIHIKQARPSIEFEDTDTGSYGIIGFDNGGFGFQNYTASVGGDSRTVFAIEDGAPANSIYVTTAGRAGFGTATPAQGVHFVSGKFAMRFENSSTGTIWDLVASDDLSFNLINDGSGTAVSNLMTLENNEGSFSTFVRGVGIFEGNPKARLHVQSPDGEGNILRVERTTGTTRFIPMALFVNKGPAQNVFQDTANGYAITFGALSTGNGSFEINNNTHLGAEFILSSVGNLTLQGTISSASSRSLKEGFVDVDPAQFLQRVAALPISIWNYQGDSAQRHVGPMAEDFWAAFGFGEGDQTISVNDAAGVSLAAIKGLYQVVEGQRSELQASRAKNESLEARLAELEALVSRLAAGGN